MGVRVTCSQLNFKLHGMVKTQVSGCKKNSVIVSLLIPLDSTISDWILKHASFLIWLKDAWLPHSLYSILFLYSITLANSWHLTLCLGVIKKNKTITCFSNFPTINNKKMVWILIWVLHLSRLQILKKNCVCVKHVHAFSSYSLSNMVYWLFE
jgi:hypothetical protein